MYKLIIVDDEQEVREGLVELIDWTSIGFRVMQCMADGREAMAYLQTNDVDVVLTDIKMTFVSGLELAKFIHDTKRSIRVVLLSGYQEFHLAQEAIRYQVVHYLLKPTEVDEMIDIFQSIYNELEETKTKVDMQSEFNRHYGKRLQESVPAGMAGTSAAAEKANIRKAKQYILEHHASDISLSSVAERVGLSTVYLSKLFKQESGENFSDYLTRVRIEKAKEYLKDPHYKIYEISELIGYKNLKHFYKLFRKFTGFTPSEYRDMI